MVDNKVLEQPKGELKIVEVYRIKIIRFYRIHLLRSLCPVKELKDLSKKDENWQQVWVTADEV